MKPFIFLFLISCITLVNCGYLTGHHPLPHNILSSRTTFGNAGSGGSPTGAYSSSHFTRTIASSPVIQSSISTHHPANYGYNQRQNQGYNSYNQGYGGGSGSSQTSSYPREQFTPYQGYASQSSNSPTYGSQNHGLNQGNGYSNNHGSY